MKTFRTLVLSLLVVLTTAFAATAHVTPSVKMATTREAVSRLLPEGKLYVKEIELNDEQMDKLKAQGNWTAHENCYRFIISRDENDKFLGAAVFITEHTRHGPVVVAVGLTETGQVKEVLVTDVQSEMLGWAGTLLRNGFLDSFRGKNSGMPLSIDAKVKAETTGMTQSFALIIANAVKRSAQLFDLVFT